MIEIAISTHENRIKNIELPTPHEKIKYIIIHQSKNKIDLKEEIYNREDVTYILSPTTGISKSRNIAIENSDTECLLITDDDVSLNIENIIKASKYFREQNLSVLTLEYIFNNGEKPRTYPKKPFNHNYFSAAKVASIEIMLNPKKILKEKIFFDENFGLGTSAPSGEEYIFITDCIKKNLRPNFLPLTIAQHPNFTSGQDFLSSKDKILAKKLMFERIFEKSSGFFKVLFFIKKAPQAIINAELKNFIRYFLIGK